MNETIGFERVFRVADYETVRFTSALGEIPPELMTNAEFTHAVRTLQFMDVEESIRRYLAVHTALDQLEPREAVDRIVEKKTELMEKIENLIKGTGE